MKKNKIYIAVVTLLLIIFVSWYLLVSNKGQKITNYISKEATVSSANLNQKNTLKKQLIKNIKDDNDIQSTVNNLVEIKKDFVTKGDQQVAPKLLDNISLKKIEKEIDLYAKLNSPGFNYSARGKLLTHTPTTLFKFSEASEGLQEVMERQLAQDKKYGYTTIGEEYIDGIINAHHYIIGTYPIEKFDLAPANIPQYITNNYNYLGYTFPDYNDNWLSSSHGTLWRIFQAKDANYYKILISESNGGGFKFEEFVNAKIGKYPATYGRLQSPNNKALTTLSWDIGNYSFGLHFIGLPNNDNKNILIKFAEELTKANTK